MKMPYVYFAALAIGVVLLTPSHIDGTIGVYIFDYFNLPVYSKSDQTGFHIVNITGILVLAFGVIGVTSHLQTRFPSILKVLLVSIVFIIVVTPLLVKFCLIMLYYQSDSERSIYIPDQICNIEIVGNEVNAFCNIKIMNYGKSNSIELIPHVANTSYEIEMDNRIIHLTPHYQHEFEVSLQGILLQPQHDNQLRTTMQFNKIIKD